MHVMLELDGEEYDLYLVREGDVVKVEVGGDTLEAKVAEGGIGAGAHAGDDKTRPAGRGVAVTLAGQTVRVDIGERSVIVDGRELPYRVLDFHSAGAPGAHGGPRKAAKIKPPMPGKIVNVAVKEGDDVQPGQLLVVLEAMKMQNEIVAPGAAKVKKVNVKPGQTVEAKDVLVELE